MSERKKTLEKWQLEDAARLMSLWHHRPRDASGKQISQREFGDKYDLGGQAGTWQYLNGRIPLNVRAALAFANELQCDIASFSPQIAEEIGRTRGPDRATEVIEGVTKLPPDDQQSILDFILYKLQGADARLFGDGKTLQHYFSVVQRWRDDITDRPVSTTKSEEPKATYSPSPQPPAKAKHSKRKT